MNRPWPRLLVRLTPDWARDVLGPALGWALDASRQPPVGLLPGPQPDGTSAAGLPVVLVLVIGEPSEEAVGDVVERLASAVSAGCGSRLVVVLDTPHLNLVRRAGMVVEYLIPRRVLTQRFPQLRYDSYVAERLTDLSRDYATEHLVALRADHPPEPQEVVRLLRPPTVGWARRRIRGAAARAERFLDRSTFSW